MPTLIVRLTVLASVFAGGVLAELQPVHADGLPDTLGASELFPYEQRLFTTNEAVGFDYFGQSVDIEGDWAVVGMPQMDVYGLNNVGHAYIFRKTDSFWQVHQQLIGKITLSYFFGSSVSISGDTIVVGARHSVGNFGLHLGTATVYVRQDDDTWIREDEVTGGHSIDYFGNTVSVSGDTMVVGAQNSREDDDDRSRGAAYVFSRSNQVWTLDTVLWPSEGVYTAQFGTSVAIDGSTLIVGAPLEKVEDVFSGTAYIYTRDGGGWVLQRKLIGPVPSFKQFGISVGISGNRVIVGAERVNTAFIYVRNGQDWSLEETLVDSANFGCAVAIHGDHCVVGANNNDSSAGKALLFGRDQEGWTPLETLLPDGIGPNDKLGTSVAIDNRGSVILGAPGDNGNSILSSSAFVYWNRLSGTLIQIR